MEGTQQDTSLTSTRKAEAIKKLEEIVIRLDQAALDGKLVVPPNFLKQVLELLLVVVKV